MKTDSSKFPITDVQSSAITYAKLIFNYEVKRHYEKLGRS